LHSPDTSEPIAKLQEEAYVRMGEAGRLRVALELSDLAHSFALAGTKQRHPHLTDEEARRLLATTLYGCAP